MDWQLTMFVMLITFIALAVPVFAILSPLIVRKLAELELFFAVVAEGQARPVIWNKQFSKFIMNYSGYCFAGQLDRTLRENNEEYWEVVRDQRLTRPHRIWKFFRGLYYIGFIYFAEIQRYKMTWIEWGYPKRPDGILATTKAPISHEEIISHVLVQSDVYFVKVLSAETSEGIPVDVGFLLTISITNPYKALYIVQHWLEAVANQSEGTTRVYIGAKEIRQLFAPPPTAPGTIIPVGAVGALSETSSSELAQSLQDRLKNFNVEFGVHVELVQIQSMEPAGDAAAKYRELLTKKYEAEREAEMFRIAADAEAYRIQKEAEAQQKAAEMVVGTVSRIPGGVDIFHSQQVGGLQNLRTYVEGDRKGKGPIIAIPADRGE